MRPNNNMIKEALNKAFLKLPPTRQQIEMFKTNISHLLDQINDSEGEEFHKNEISEFLKKSFYSPNHYINTKARYDMVIHNGKESSSTVGVIVEAKSPGNRSEMPTIDNLNAKAIRELILYYLRERITNKNLELKHLIATNLYEWFIFDAHEFEKHFANNKSLIKQFTDFEEGRSSGKDTFFFYNSIAAPYLETLESEIKFTHFDLRNYETIIGNDNSEDDLRLIPLFKFLSPEHLLKLPFKNDSNSLDKDFYRELLYIIGLEESNQGSKKLICRASEKNRNYGSLLESTISILNIEDSTTQVPRLSDFGDTKEDQLFNISLELVITWINRVLFLKLLEGQLVRYNQGDKSFRFLNQNSIPDYDSLNKLFFHILAIPEPDRDERIKSKFSKIPYLNSSLFEPTDLELKTIRISNLDSGNNLPILKNTVLRDAQGKRSSGVKPTLLYLFDFLDAFNFSSEGTKVIQEENKTLINASVLGLIFEKINGYQDGSFFTPGFITQYICHETISKAVIQKFNEAKGWFCATLNDVNNKIEDKEEANKIINDLRICDPAVGSGHFLVSALNEIISIKSELKILMDQQGKVLRDYHFEVINDELIISDPDGELFEYNPKNHESHRVQEAIFHEKQIIIENCLFGVDINPNSVKICRLRLWIELLKHAYYKSGTQTQELETLPNIDINIKCGNSLISRYPLDSNIKDALKSSKWTVNNYRDAVMSYRNSETKQQKRAMEKLIFEIKSNFESEISKNDKRFIKLNKLNGELLAMTTQQRIFELGNKEKDEWNHRLNKLVREQADLEGQLNAIRDNKIYENSFEWRFEFPEVLNDQADFVGFDVVIGNPPYLRQESITSFKPYLKEYYSVFNGRADLYVYFYERALQILRQNGALSFITSNKFFRGKYGTLLKEHLSNFCSINNIIDFGELPVFEEASTFPMILMAIKRTQQNTHFNYSLIKSLEKVKVNTAETVLECSLNLPIEFIRGSSWILSSSKDFSLLDKLKKNNVLKNSVTEKIYSGIKTGLNKAFWIDNKIRTQLESEDINSKRLIKRLSRGDDIRKWHIRNSNLFIIYTYQGLNIDDFPAIRNYLLQFKSELESRALNQPWWQLQQAQNRTGIWENIKIVYPDICKESRFTSDSNGIYIDMKGFIIPVKNYFLLGLLNSKVVWWFLKQTCAVLGDPNSAGRLQLKRQYVELIPIPNASEDQKNHISELVEQILLFKKSDPSTNVDVFETEIDQAVYDLYMLTEDEIKIVEGK
jgi:hypothetical protein